MAVIRLGNNISSYGQRAEIRVTGDSARVQIVHNVGGDTTMGEGSVKRSYCEFDDSDTLGNAVVAAGCLRCGGSGESNPPPN